MRVLAVPPPDPSHLVAMVPLCWALRAAGHEVLVACQPDVAPAGRAAGLSVAEIGMEARLTEHARRFTPPETYPSVAFAERDSEAGRFLWEVTAITFVEHANTNIQGYVRLAEAWRADLVLTNPEALLGRVLGGVLGVPVVSYRWGVDPTAGPFETKAQELLGRLCSRLGLPGLPDPALIVDPCPPSLQLEDAPKGQSLRFAPYNGTGILPDWALDRPSGRRVCVSMGQSVLSLAGPRPFQRAIEALSGLDDVEVIAALTPEHRQAVGDLPEGVRVAESVPLNLFLGTCDLLIHHGGAGTGLTGTSFGLPQLVLPQFFDQFDYGRQLAEAGAGITIADAAGQDDVDGIRAAISKLLDDPGYASAAAKLRAEIEAATPADAVVDILEQLAGSDRVA
jgi:UDP:flavonoid glycosyltransferase YjiC (YdhE family)